MWNADQYLKFSSHRDRPFFDLIGQIPSTFQPQHIADLGCGTGHLTAALLERFSTAQIIGIENSPSMLDQAVQHQQARLEFINADLRTWQPAKKLDLIVSNAALQWVSDHQNLLPQLVDLLEPNGVLAVQMPANFDAPSHTILHNLILEYKAHLPQMLLEPRHSHSADWYIQMLNELGLTVNAWETTYMQVLHGKNPVLEWVKGTALRPVLTALEPSLQPAFLQQYQEKLLEAYPKQSFGTLFPFRRLFFIAQKQV
jgi:trans-aconitate 2-methyltransferase